MSTYNNEIVLCTRCKGEGKIFWDECTNYHKREYETHSKECPDCNGTGRLRKITEIRYEKIKGN